jgi:ribose/xylose/arabinose/galactoside ABC-type transport system permease subunit
MTSLDVSAPSEQAGNAAKPPLLFIVPAVLVGLALVWVVTPNFYSAENLRTLLLQASILGIVTLGQALVLLVAGLDLSVGAVMSVSLVVIASVSRVGDSAVVLAVATALAVGLLVGLGNGLLVAFRGVNPFIVTFGMAAVVSGAQLVYTRGAPPGSIPDSLRTLTQEGLGILPWAAFLWILLTVGLAVVLRRSTTGRRIYAVGNSRAVATRAGIPTKWLICALYAACAVFAAIAGVVLSAYVGYVDSSIGRGYELDSIAAAVVGGVAFSGGNGGVLGAALGALGITVILNVLVLSGLGPNAQLIVRGLVILIALAVVGWRLTKART